MVRLNFNAAVVTLSTDHDEQELNTLEKLIKEQLHCVSEMTAQYRILKTQYNKGIKGMDFLVGTAQFLNKHKEQINSMRESTQAAKQAYRGMYPLLW